MYNESTTPLDAPASRRIDPGDPVGIDVEEDLAQYPSAPLEVLGYVLRASANASDAIADRSRGRVLEVAQIFGDTVLAMQQVPRGESVLLGTGDDALEVPLESLPSPTHALFEPSGSGWMCALDPRWAAFVEKDGVRRTLQELRADGTASRSDDGFVRLPIEEGDRLVVDIGGILFVAQAVWPSKRALPAGLGEIDHGILGMTGFMSFVAVLLGVALWRVPEPPKVSMSEEKDNSHLVHLMETLPKPEVKNPGPTAGAPAAKKAEGASKPQDKKTIATKPKTDQEVATESGLLGALTDSELSATLGETSLNSNLMNGIGSLIAGKASSNGTGLGQRGGGLGGGGSADQMGSFGPKSRGPGGNSFNSGGEFGKKREGGDVTREANVIIMGSIDKSLIDAVIKQNMSQIRYCYQRELTKNPALSGKITVKFVIAGDGSVSSATTKTTTMNNPSVESCINGRFMRFGFPEPKGNGIVIVSYPFLFSPS